MCACKEKHPETTCPLKDVEVDLRPAYRESVGSEVVLTSEELANGWAVCLISPSGRPRLFMFLENKGDAADIAIRLRETCLIAMIKLLRRINGLPETPTPVGPEIGLN